MTRTLGLGLAGALVLSSATMITAAPAHAGVSCFSAGVSDFNGDGHADAVIADPDATVGGLALAGRVFVLYGSDGQLGVGGPRVVLTAASVGLPVHAGDRFGSAVAIAQVDMDSCADLVIGIPRRDVAGQGDAGAIGILFGSTTGINGNLPPQVKTQASMGGVVEAGDRLGSAVAAGTYLGSDISVVVAGAPGENLGDDVDTGVINTLDFSDSGGVWATEYSQDTPGIPGTNEDGDLWGSALTMAPNLLDDSGYYDTLVGAPGEDVGSANGAGSVTVIAGIHGGDPLVAISVTQNTAGVPGTAESGDRFGASLAADGTQSQPRSVVVGSPGEAIGSVGGAGSVTYFANPGGGSLGIGVGLTQNSAGVPGVAEVSDQFGASVALLPGGGQFAVGVAGEDIGAGANTGSVQVFDEDADHVASYDLDSPGASGALSSGAAYGSALAGFVVSGERGFLVGAPGQPGVGGSGIVHVISDHLDRSWLPGAGGLPAGGVRFGAAVGINESAPS